jgi:hypothetical protein
MYGKPRRLGEMNEEMVQQMMAAAERLAAATETLDRVLGKLDAQQEMLNSRRALHKPPSGAKRKELEPNCRSALCSWRSRMQT